jgi:hypothetical protein
MTHYDTLGVPRDAPAARIRGSYLALVRQLHPDSLVGRPSAEIARAGVRFRAVTAAWEVLGDPEARRSYDRSLVVRAPRPATASSGTTARPMHTSSSSPPPSPLAADEVEVMPGGCLPLGFVLGGVAVLVVLAIALLTIGFVQSPTGSRQSPVTDDAVLSVAPGDCVMRRTPTERVPCSTEQSLKIVTIARAPTRCSERYVSVPYDIRFWLCVVSN